MDHRSRRKHAIWGRVGIFATNFVSLGTLKNTRTGWVAGAGAETPLPMMPHLLVRVEYLYYGFDSNTTIQANLVPNPGAFPLPFVYNWRDNNVQVVRAGLSYKF